jgi:general secretion pathway protein J
MNPSIRKLSTPLTSVSQGADFIMTVGFGPAPSAWKKSKRRSREGDARLGFTLVELLIAMALIGMILVIVFSGLRLSTRSWEAAEQKLQEIEKVRVVENLFRRQIHEARLLFYNDPDAGRALNFTGTSQTMQFVAPLLARIGLGGLYWITFEVVNSGGEARLLMTWRPYRPGEQSLLTQEPEVVLEGMEEIAFSYFGIEAGEEMPLWHYDWTSLEQPPQLVRLSVRAQDRVWPDVLVNFRTTPLESGGAGGFGFGSGGGVSRQLRLDFGP